MKYFYLLTFLICFIYPPLVFNYIINDTFRIILFIIHFIILNFLYIYFTNRLNYNKLIILLLFIVTAICNYFSSNESYTFINSLNYLLITSFGILFYELFENKKTNFLAKYARYYINIFYVISIFSILNFIYNLFPFINLNLNSFPIDKFEYDYNVSIFGISIRKEFFGINISRNQFFFVEPVFISLFYVFNVFFVSNSITKNKKRFIFLNLIGGLLTFSFLFYILSTFLFFRRMKKKSIMFLIYAPLLILLIIILSISFDTSSYLDRIIRFNYGLEIIKNMSVKNLITGGSQFGLNSDIESGVSAGILSLLIEGGIFNLILHVSIFKYIIKNKDLFLIILISLFVFEPYKYPFFWISLLISIFSIKPSIAKNLQ